MDVGVDAERGGGREKCGLRGEKRRAGPGRRVKEVRNMEYSKRRGTLYKRKSTGGMSKNTKALTACDP